MCEASLWFNMGFRVDKKDQAFKRASGFKSKDPFCMIVMQPSYAGAKYALVSFF